MSHKFNYRWSIKNGYPSKGFEYHGKTVFSCFAGGAGRVHCNILYNECRFLNTKELISGGSFPTDYNFKKVSPCYIIGMSVPPVMMAQIANRIKKEWLKWN